VLSNSVEVINVLV